MTDKEIIIDGVDVSGCNCFIEKMNFPNNLEGGYYNQNNLCECGVQGVESYPFFCRNNPNCHYKQLKRKEEELQAQRNFTAQEQRKIYCVAYDKTCETGNECKQKGCVFKDRLKYKQTLTEIKDYCNKYPQNSIGFKKYILQKISEAEND